MRRFVVLGCNHSVAELDQVAGARLPAENRPALFAELRQRLGAQELVYLETCHRTEFYIAYEGELCSGRLTMALSTILPELTQGRSVLPPVGSCLALQGDKAARHLFRVASGLEALMVGDNQVLGQAKEALRTAAEAGATGPLLQTLFEQAFRAAKRVRTETSLARRPVSLISLAERQLREQLARDGGPVAVLGAGDMGALAAQLIRKLDPGRDVVLFNRGNERGERIAATVGARFAPLGDFAADGNRFSVVVAATSAPDPVITPEVAARIAPAWILDLGLPPNVEPQCAAVEGVVLVSQAELAAEAEANRAARADEIARAEALIDEQLSELAYEVVETYLSPVARQLVETFRSVARTELERFCQRPAGADNGDLDAAVERLSQRLLRLPMKGLREVAWLHSPAVLDTFLSAVQR